MSQKLTPPQPSGNALLDRWLRLLWQAVTDYISSGDSNTIIAGQAFDRRVVMPPMDTGRDVAEKQQILANQIFGG